MGKVRTGDPARRRERQAELFAVDEPAPVATVRVLAIEVTGDVDAVAPILAAATRELSLAMQRRDDAAFAMLQRRSGARRR